MNICSKGFLTLSILVLQLSCGQIEKESKSSQEFPFASEYWKVENEDETSSELSISEYEGKLAIKLEANQRAYLKGRKYKNFVLEFYCNGLSGPGFGFRVQDKKNFEYVYLRLGVSGKKDALQYVPIYHGSLPWQLYNYPKYEGRAVFPRKRVAVLPPDLKDELVVGKASDEVRLFLEKNGFSFSEASEISMGDDVSYIFDSEEMKALLLNEVDDEIIFLNPRTWIRVKAEVKGDVAAFYIENMEMPAFVVEDLKRDEIVGGISLIGDTPGVYFANVSITELKDTKAEVQQEERTDNYLTRWKMSEMFVKDSLNFISQLDSILQHRKEFMTIVGDEDGLINISRFYDDMTKSVALSCTLKSDADRLVKLNFDYADHLTIFFNSEILYDNGMNFKPPVNKGMEGRVFVDDEHVMLNLQKGSNQLNLMLSGDNRQKFNWGFVAKLENAKGISVE